MKTFIDWWGDEMPKDIPYGSHHDLAKAAWTASAERYLALADEVELERERYVLNDDYHAALEWVENRIREIAEG